MTWCANQIYARASTELIEAVQRIPAFAGHLFCVTALDGAQELPVGGLLAIYPEVGDARGLTPAAKWAALESASPETSIFLPPALAAEVESPQAALPLGLFRVLKTLQQETRSPLAYYFCQTWGGKADLEMAWIFDDVDRVYHFGALELGDKARAFVAGAPDADLLAHEGDILRCALAHVGLVLPSRLFAAHHRDFDWTRWQVPPPAPRVHPKDPLHGVTLEAIVTRLHARYGWEHLAREVPIRCFQFDPSIASSLTFLRRTPWARTEVEALFVRMLKFDASP